MLEARTGHMTGLLVISQLNVKAYSFLRIQQMEILTGHLHVLTAAQDRCGHL
jgi:hypothetical protein